MLDNIATIIAIGIGVVGVVWAVWFENFAGRNTKPKESELEEAVVDNNPN